jgi:hypothetical protein
MTHSTGMRSGRIAFADILWESVKFDTIYVNTSLFTRETTFHVSGSVNMVRRMGYWNSPRHLRTWNANPKVNFRRGVTRDRVCRAIFFADESALLGPYLDAQQLFVPQL